MSTSETSPQKKRPSYEELDRESQYKQTVRIIEQNPKEAAERAAHWNAFIAEHPDFANVPMTFDAVKEWAKKKKVDLPYASRIMRDRDIAEMLASDKAREEGTWKARTKTKTKAAPDQADEQAAAQANPATEAEPPKKKRRKRELTPEQAEDAAQAAEFGFSFTYGKEPISGDQIPLAGTGAHTSDLDWHRYGPELPPLFNRAHWHANHAKSDAYKERKKREMAEQLIREGYLSAPAPGDREFVPESHAEFAAHTKALLDSSQMESGPDEARATISDMEKPPRATPPPAESGELSSQETAERILDYYDHRDEVPAPAESGVLSSQETAERYLEHYDNPVETAAAEPATAEQELDLSKVADANVAFDDEPAAEKLPDNQSASEDPLAQPDTTPKPEGMEDFTWDKYLKERSVTLEKSAEAMGEKEGSWIRNLGEHYNNLNWKWKLALGATLGGAAAAGMVFGSPVALIAGAFGTAGQRVLGGLGMFVKAENYLQNKASANEKDEATWKRQLKAAAAALAYTGLATFGIKKAIDYTADWLGHMWPGDAAEGIHGQPVREIADQLPTAPEAPSITVEATKGKGYEFMAKRLWEQLHSPDSGVDQGFFASHPESDAAKLWNAKPEEIDALVHKLATEHGFYQTDAENVLIKPDSVLGFTPDGEIRLGVPGGSEVVDASSDASVTPPYNPESADAPVADAEVPQTTEPVDQHTAILDHENNAIGHESAAPEHSFINKHGIEVFDSEPNLYADRSGKELFVYGGTPGQQGDFIQRYFDNPQNADKVLYGSDAAGNTRVAWRLVNGELTPSPVAKSSFLGFGRGFEKAPSPDDLRMLIK